MRKPGILPARIPEITKSSRTGMIFTHALQSKHRQRRVAYKGKLTTSSAPQGSSQPWVPHGDSTYLHLSTQWFPVMCGNRCLVLLHAPPIFCPHFIVPYSGPAHFASQLLCLCCPPSPCLSCASLRVLPCGARVIVLSLCSCGLAVSLGFCAPRCACAGLGVSRVVCPPLLLFLSL